MVIFSVYENFETKSGAFMHHAREERHSAFYNLSCLRTSQNQQRTARRHVIMDSQNNGPKMVGQEQPS
jgi:hypothetical protein